MVSLVKSSPVSEGIHKVVNYVVEKMVLDKPLDSLSGDGTFVPGSGSKPWKLKPSVEILCNNQASFQVYFLSHCN
nr:hypothetical protein [Tanacetum cinerariifolium]